MKGLPQRVRVFLSWFNALQICIWDWARGSYGLWSLICARPSQRGVETGPRNGWDLEKEGRLACLKRKRKKES